MKNNASTNIIICNNYNHNIISHTTSVHTNPSSGNSPIQNIFCHRGNKNFNSIVVITLLIGKNIPMCSYYRVELECLYRS